MEELGKPFSDTTPDLYTLDSKVIMSDNVVHTIRTIEDTGKMQYQQFIESRIMDKFVSFFDTIHKNSLPLFSCGSGKTATKSTSKIANLQNDVNLFSRMYISSQA